MSRESTVRRIVTFLPADTTIIAIPAGRSIPCHSLTRWPSPIIASALGLDRDLPALLHRPAGVVAMPSRETEAPGARRAAAAEDASTYARHGVFAPDPHPRLSLPTSSRLLLGSVFAGVVGFTLGALQGGQMAQLRFRAEHAHKMPDTTAGWYLYHKSKNYHAMHGGIREGFRMGAKTSFWSLLALGLESTVDQCRGARDMFSTTVATLTVAGAFSLWSELPILAARDVPWEARGDSLTRSPTTGGSVRPVSAADRRPHRPNWLFVWAHVRGRPGSPLLGPRQTDRLRRARPTSVSQRPVPVTRGWG